MRRNFPIGILCLTALVPVLAGAQEDSWETITDPAALRAMFSDVELSGQLRKGAEATATYNSDGTAELRAWGETFPRTWNVTDDGLVCIEYLTKKECSAIDGSKDGTKFRERNLTTGELVIFTVDPANREATDSGAQTTSKSVAPSADELARELANPNTVLARLTLKTQFRSYTGDLPKADDQEATMMLFQPSAPFPLARKGDSILFRPAIPIFFDQPYFDGDKGKFRDAAALGDISFDLAYSRSTPTGWLFAGGIIATMPTATKDELGKDLWTAGPEVLFGKITKKYVVGAFPNHQWDFAGSGDGDVSISSSQLFGVYLPGGGWSMGTTPILSYDWETEEWTVPINATISKTTIIAGRPWKFGIEINYYPEQPDAFGPEWMVGFEITPVVANKVVEWFKGRK